MIHQLISLVNEKQAGGIKLSESKVLRFLTDCRSFLLRTSDFPIGGVHTHTCGAEEAL